MLRHLRSNTGRWLFGCASLLIIPSFVFLYGWNSSNPMDRRPDTAVAHIGPGAVIPSGNITNADLERAERLVKQRVAGAMALAGQSPELQVIEQAASYEETFLAALDAAAVAAFAKNNGLRIGVEQVAKTLAEREPDPDARIRLIMSVEQQLGIKFDAWLEQQRELQTFELAQELIKDQVRVTANEAWIEHSFKNEKLFVESVVFDADDFRDTVPKPTTASLEAYLAENGERFRVPAQGVYKFIAVTKDELQRAALVDDAETSAVYEQSQERFTAPRAVRASMILVPGPEDSTSTTATEAATRIAAEVAERARKGEDFSALHAQFSAPYNLPSREVEEESVGGAGFLGLVSEASARTAYGDDWTSAVFNSSPGAVVGPLGAANGGNYVVKVSEIREPRLRPLEDVRDEIVNELRQKKADEEFTRIGALLDEKSREVTTLEGLAEATGTTVTKTGRMNRDSQVLPKIGFLGSLQDAVRDLDKGGDLDLLSDERRHLLIQMIEEHPSRIPDLSEVRSAVESAVVDRDALSLARAKAEEAGKKIAAGEPIDTVAVDAQTTVTRPDGFTRDAAAESLGYFIDDFAGRTRGLRLGDLVIEEARPAPGSNPNAVALLRLTGIQTPSIREFREKLPEITAEIRNRKRQAFINDHFAFVRMAISQNVKLISPRLLNR